MILTHISVWVKNWFYIFSLKPSSKLYFDVHFPSTRRYESSIVLYSIPHV